MFGDTSVSDYHPAPPVAPRRRAGREGVCEPEPLLVVCFVCGSARDGADRWSGDVPFERLLAGRVTHALCPACLEQRYPEPGLAAARA